jgi:hypothetical protein
MGHFLVSPIIYDYIYDYIFKYNSISLLIYQIANEREHIVTERGLH